VERLADGAIAIRHYQLESLRHIVDVNVLQRCGAIVWQRNALAAAEAFEYGGIEIPGGVDRHPTRSGDMTRMKDRGRISCRSFGEEEPLDFRFEYSVLTERLARLGFRIRTSSGIAVHPQRSAMDELRNLAAQRIDEVLRGRRREADEIDNDVGSEGGDLWTE
jgi:hypothetical protein